MIDIRCNTPRLDLSRLRYAYWMMSSEAADARFRSVSGWRSEQMQFGTLNKSACVGAFVTSVAGAIAFITR